METISEIGTGLGFISRPVPFHKSDAGRRGDSWLSDASSLRANMGEAHRLVPGERRCSADHLYAGFSSPAALRSKLEMDAVHWHLSLAHASNVPKHCRWTRAIQERGILHVLPRHETVRGRPEGPHQQNASRSALQKP